MSVFDCYITREFLKILGIALAAFVVIFILVDVFDNIDTFIDRRAPLETVVLYYLYMCPYILVLTLPVASLLASLLSVGSLARHNELVAMKTSGVSLYRILTPLFAVGAVLSLVVVFVGGWSIPVLNEKLRMIENYEIKRKPSREGEAKRNLVYQDSDGIAYHVAVLHPAKGIAEGVRVIAGGEGTVTWRLDAEKGTYTTDAWRLESGFLRVFSGDTELAAPFSVLWSSMLDASVEDIMGRPQDPEELGVRELRTAIKQRSRSGLSTAKHRVELQIRFSFPLASFLMVLLGAPLASNPRRSGLALSFGLSIAVSFAFFGATRACQALGHHETLPPSIAAWLPELVFLLCGVAILVKVRK
jgi:lipopolysaccharide export system permease protein